MSDGTENIKEGIDQALERLDGDRELLFELFELFQSDRVQYVSQFEAAVRALDFKAIEQVGHSLKSALANIGANEVSALCYEFEKAGRISDGTFPYAERFALFEPMFDRYAQYMEKLRAGA